MPVETIVHRRASPCFIGEQDRDGDLRDKRPGAVMGTMNREEIFESVRDVLIEALGVDDDEVTPEASLTGDLGAESIDFLDIVFRLEKSFSTAERPFKIGQGELFPENLMENDEWVKDGRFTDEGMAML